MRTSVPIHSLAYRCHLRPAALTLLTFALGAAPAIRAQAPNAQAHASGSHAKAHPSSSLATREARSTSGGPLDASRLRDTALASLVRAERLFMDDVEHRRLEGWVAGFADSAATFPPGRPLQVGREPIRRGMTPVFADTSVHVAWHPVYATIASSGELGYTYGYYHWTQRDSVGTPAPPQDGKYLTVWRRDPTGKWRVVVDLGNGGPVPAGFFANDASP